jgi:tetratricopeptide (TPR) repeat protein
MNDLVIQSLVTNLFWLVLVVLIVASFRQELKNLLNSLGSFKIAGASFELKDSRASIEYYVVLTNIVVEILLDRESAQAFGGLISGTSVRQLSKFAIKYSKDVPEDVKQVELLKNVAMIIGRRGNIHDALSFLDALLKESPNDLDILNLKANLLTNARSQENYLLAEPIYDRLVKERPNNRVYRFNRALTKVALGKHAEAMVDLEVSVREGYWKRRKDMLQAPALAPLRLLPEFEDLQRFIQEKVAAQVAGPESVE